MRERIGEALINLNTEPLGSLENIHNNLVERVEAEMGQLFLVDDAINRRYGEIALSHPKATSDYEQDLELFDD